jgi:fructose-1,6-bisphosphatase-3
MHIDPRRLAMLRSLSARFPNAETAIAEIAALRAKLTLPMGVVHVISDIHGEDAKLRHVINNASGALRRLVDEVVGERLAAREKQRFLAVLYYPREAINAFSHEIVASGRRLDWVYETLTLQFEIIRSLRKTYRRDHFEHLVPSWYRELFLELAGGQRPDYIREMITALAAHDRDWGAVRAGARLIRNLSVGELIVAGDLGDRGPRMDRVCEILMRQPRVSMLWGNHDMLWIGAHLGHEPTMLTCLRFSVRYRRLSQLEEGYGVMMAPLERLVRQVYADDPAERFAAKGEGFRDALTIARMQKAVAVMQFKAEGRMLARRPEWGLEHRRLLHRIRWEGRRAVEVEIDGRVHPMLDQHLPTVDPRDPYAYSPEERACVDRLKESFTRSMALRRHVGWMVRHGGMWTRRDDVLMFHACVPVDERGEPLSMRVDGRDLAGRELMDALGGVVRRAFRKRWFGLDDDADYLWYLWGGPRSPLFGKDRLATFETYFVADKEAHKERKNPYFDLMHDADFIRRIGRMFGCGDDVLVVNGHVPVKIEKGEQPVKRGGNAITIDGAFSEAYGDRGYTLVLRPDAIELAELAPFGGVESVLHAGADIEPEVRTIRTYPRTRLVGDTHEGEQVRHEIENLEALVEAYQDGLVVEQEERPGS